MQAKKYLGNNCTKLLNEFFGNEIKGSDYLTKLFNKI